MGPNMSKWDQMGSNESKWVQMSPKKIDKDENKTV